MQKNHGICLLLVFLLFSSLLPAQEEQIREEVSVLNFEVPVRVFYAGQAVSGLSKDDFQIYEDGKLQAINGFYIIRKKIGESPVQEKKAIAAPVLPKRYFVLVYNIFEYNRQLQDSLDYLFQKMLRPDDRLLVLTDNGNLNFTRLGNDEQAKNKIAELLLAECKTKRGKIYNSLHKIERIMPRDEELTAESIKKFLTFYLEYWRDFKRRYLLLDIDRFYGFAKQLERVNSEKWVLSFYQREQFPQINFSGHLGQPLRSFIAEMEISESVADRSFAVILRKLLLDIDKEMQVADTFPAEEISKLFYKVNATFHSFFMRIFKDTGNTEFQYRDVANDIEKSLRLITEKTGGSLLVSNDLTRSLGAVAEKEDILYMLTYEPSHAKKIGKIKVAVKDRNCYVVYDNNMRADHINEYLQKKAAELPSVRIRDLAFKDKKLSLSICDFSLAKHQDETTGILLVHVRIKNSENRTLLDQEKVLQAPGKTFSVSLDLNFPVAGNCIIVDVLDQVSGKTCTEFIQPRIE